MMKSPCRPLQVRGLIALGSLLGSTLLPVPLAATEPGAATLTIEHDAVGCVQAEVFPRLLAGITPSDQVTRIRLRFRPAGFDAWYSVAMKREGGGFTGVLPKPKKSLEALDYYIEATDRGFGTTRTQEYRA